MAELGNLLIILSFILTLYIPLAAFVSVKTRHAGLLESARRAFTILFISLTTCCGMLTYLLVTKDYSFYYVWRYTSLHLPAIYAASALWAGNAGSLMFWAWLLSGYSVLAINIGWRRNLPYMPVVLGVLSITTLFFVSLLLILPNLNTESPPHTNPFETIPGTPPTEGSGLNPQLENPFMVIHPPSLYLGYVGFSIPFAFAMAALVGRRLDSTWIRSTRHWTLIAWFFLSIGNILGGWWAYVTLGWGGYWAWDPVENAAFIPWLLGTAYLHSVMIQETKGMLKIWNIVLVILTFLSTLFGTFLTRSGIIQSVHAFARSPEFSAAFLGFMFFAGFVATCLLLYRLKDLRSEARMESLLSRESSFLFNNVLLVASAFTIVWGTLFPVISETFRGERISVGPPFYNQVLTPVWLAFIFLMGVGPLIGWRKASWRNFRRNLLGPIILGILTAVVLAGYGVREFWALTFLPTCVFVTATIVVEFARGVKVRAEMTQKPLPVAAFQLVGRQKRRYGGYIIHFGVVVLVVGIVLSSLYKREKQTSLELGQSVVLNPYVLTYVDFEREIEPHKQIFTSKLRVQRGDRTFTIGVEQDYFPNNESVRLWSRATIRSNWEHDLYVTMPELDYSPFESGGDPSTPPKTIALTVRVLPGILWMWIGGLILVVGTIVAMWPDAIPEHLRGRAPAKGQTIGASA